MADRRKMDEELSQLLDEKLDPKLSGMPPEHIKMVKEIFAFSIVNPGTPFPKEMENFIRTHGNLTEGTAADYRAAGLPVPKHLSKTRSLNKKKRH